MPGSCESTLHNSRSRPEADGFASRTQEQADTDVGFVDRAKMSGLLTVLSCLHRDDWPQAYWDDWMRLNKTRKGRQCIRPEVCRTYNFGEKGSSKGFYYKRFLAPIRLSAAELDWSKVDLSYLQQSRCAFTRPGAPSCLSTITATL